MKQIRCDVAVIGAGTAGLTAERAAAAEGAETCLIEGGPGGTTCARVGCMPSKLLISAAEAAHMAGFAGRFGIDAGSVRVDGRRVMARVREERDRFVGGVLKGIEKHPPTHYVSGQARFLDPHTLMVDDHTRVTARSIVLATGALPVVPEPFRRLGPGLLTNETVFELEDLPASIAVIGAGPLGLEIAQALHRLGVRTTVFDRGDRLGGLSDPLVDEAATAVFREEFDLRLGVDLAPAIDGDGIRIGWDDGNGGSGETSFSHVLLATGRRPALKALDLDRSGLPLDDHGTPEFDPQTLQCGGSSIFIAGDANHDRPILHEAAAEGRAAGRNAARHPDLAARRRTVPLSIVFTDPQIAAVGTFEPDDPAIVAGSVDFATQGRARVMGKNEGLLRVYGDSRTGRLTGAQMACPGAEHLAQLIAWAVEAELTARALIDLPYYHPTLEEGLRSAFRDLCSTMRVAPAVGSPTHEYGPGT